MFTETITIPAPEFEQFEQRVELFADPPPGLLSAICYEDGPDDVSLVMLWETASARGDFAADRVMTRTQDLHLTRQPERRTPVHTYVRGVAPVAG